VFCDLEEVLDAMKPAGAGELRSDVIEGNRDDRINFDLALFHPVSLAGRDAWLMPDANARTNCTRSDSIADIS
jgi:hypothetical protein